MKDEIIRVVGEAEGAKAAVDNEDEATTLQTYYLFLAEFGPVIDVE